MKNKSLYLYSFNQRKGIFLLLLVMIFTQAIYFFWSSNTTPQKDKEDHQWLALQSHVDSLKQVKEEFKPTIYPFNPNFISDVKGYRLGMSVEELDRLFAFRKQNKYVNSAKEFQSVTGVSDSLLAVISPYFKFPDWVNQPQKEYVKFENKISDVKPKTKIDINLATQEDLIKVYGIGPALSERILKQREVLGGFASMEQLAFVWGLNPDVIENVNKSFAVVSTSGIKKIKINDLSIKELSKFPYFNYTIAKEIVTYRSMKGDIQNIEDLTKINGFPVEKLKFIALYLEF
ncbi:ComEA family DNA-binding protein [Flavobacterium filum]|uniref:ComEA family DNA-binding protein n=1 Tax=Flavobacterium filum TaxID=370974 RepID=UPI000427EA4B|nr:helix-hairpin-helix domain-containing protein [Flavobacterium filum]